MMRVPPSENFTVQAPENSLILWCGVDDSREELSFLTQIERTPGVGGSKKIHNSLKTVAPRRCLNVLRDDRRKLNGHSGVARSTKRFEEGR
jgi:hypothetical protein